jgi:alpha-ketoglutarate-dependent 2,4-dichlorophenoxyacetate dioxygenase
LYNWYHLFNVEPLTKKYNKMPSLITQPLQACFGVEIKNIDLATIDEVGDFPAIRKAFDNHSLLLFRDQNLEAEDHLRFGRMLGPIEDREADDLQAREGYEVPKVSNVRNDGSIAAEMDLHTLHLKSNMLWHTDSTFLPVPALANIITAKIVTDTGGATEIASSRAAWADMPKGLKDRVQNASIWHRYSHSRAKISKELAALPMFHKWDDQHWKAIWTNPANGEEAVYIASHAFKVDGLSDNEGTALIEEVVEFCTQPKYVYSHDWQVGDVLVWDERATLHRATPWPYDQPRSLNSICVSVTDSDGLSEMRPD